MPLPKGPPIRIRSGLPRDFSGYTSWWYVSDGTRHGMGRGRGRAVVDLRKRYSARERLHPQAPMQTIRVRIVRN